jgi:hypothetical protein
VVTKAVIVTSQMIVHDSQSRCIAKLATAAYSNHLDRGDLALVHAGICAATTAEIQGDTKM